MTGETENKRPTRILIVGSGGPVDFAQEIARKINEQNYEIQIVSPREAKLRGMKPNEDIVEMKNILPKTMQYYPKEEFEPNRRTRRKQARQNKRKK